MIAIAGLWGALAASSLLVGAWIAVRMHPSLQLVGRILGFGAGTLIAAVAYDLVPKHSYRSAWIFLAFALGALVFFGTDWAIGRHSTGGADSGRSVVLGSLLDGIPESAVLGMGLAAGGKISVAFLVAVFVSNLPEALGATSGMTSGGQRPTQIYRTWTLIVLVSGLAAAAGYGIVQLIPGSDGSYVEAFAAGAVLTMLANSMMPDAYKEGGRLAGLFTVLGFAVAGALSLAQ
jgi:ZIP family zinc transporter